MPLEDYVEVATATTNTTPNSNVNVFLSMDGAPICPNMSDAQFRAKVMQLRDDAVRLISLRIGELTAWKPNAQARLVQWFGNSDPATRPSVMIGLASVNVVLAGLTPSKFVRSSPDIDRATGCTPATKNLDGEVAHVCAPDTATHTISISPMFCTLPDKTLSSKDSKMLTIIHEATHFLDTIRTSDHAYGQFLSRRLAMQSPEKALKNADNFAWYVCSVD
ncbi:lysine-specific metallo-endopeptidase family protein [Paraburkholderia sp. BL8N3]|nr:M35 family metallo-endopeptidase [Paraburkholderia sp. BL8N3]TCK37928.1 lysine-specific metallo-endopeptidase family protein [Paraburkholderia sp. BL8N3]